MKFVLLLFSFAGILAVAIFVYGLALPQTRSVVRTVQLDADLRQVYDLVRNVQGQESWRKDIVKITLKEDGKRWLEHTKQGDILFHITEENPPYFLKLKFESAQKFHGEWVGKFSETPSGTEFAFSETITIQNPFFRGLSRIMGFTEKFMDDYVRDLKMQLQNIKNGQKELG
jgi:hypothetical protein